MVKISILGSLLIMLLGQSNAQSLLERKQALTTVIDSLEIEQQIRKRQGEPFSELEVLSQRLKDSVSVLKRNLSEGSISGNQATPLVEQAPKPVQSNVGHLKKYLPTHWLDWAILVVAALASLAGLALLMGLFISWKNRAKSRGGKAKSITGTHEFYPNLHMANKEVLPRVALEPQKSNADLSMLAALRQKVSQASTLTSDVIPRPSVPPVKTAKNTPSASGSHAHSQIRDLAQQGMDPAQIARQLHMSIDQVQLILRLSQR